MKSQTVGEGPDLIPDFIQIFSGADLVQAFGNILNFLGGIIGREHSGVAGTPDDDDVLAVEVVSNDLSTSIRPGIESDSIGPDQM